MTDTPWNGKLTVRRWVNKCPAHRIACLAKSSSYEVPHFAAFFNLLSPHPSLVQILSQTIQSHR
jgi:hypothetical protein